MAVELVERVYGYGDDCGACGDELAPGDLAVWVDGYGRVHEFCSETDSQRSDEATAASNQR